MRQMQQNRFARRRDVIWRVTLIGAALLAARGCHTSRKEEPAVVRGRAMGTTWMVRFAQPLSRSVKTERQRQIAAVIEAVEAEMSPWRDDSMVSRLNRWDSSEPFPVSQPLADVLAEAERVHRLSSGNFDITAAPLVELWGFGPDGAQAELPSDEQITAALQHVRGDRLLLESAGTKHYVRKLDPKLRVDLSSIAKGYAIDRVAGFLDEQAVEDYLIELGGELRARGTNRAGAAWRIGLEEPTTDSAGQVRRSLALANMAVATSGSYRRFHEAADAANGRQSHLIDPRSGRPVEHALVSVSVLAPTAMQADALATALFVLGPEQGKVLAERQGIAATFVIQDGDKFVERQSEMFPVP